MTIRGTIKRCVLAVACAAGALMAPATAAEALRVCADPDNLPFSKAEGPERGLYVELAEMVGKRLGSQVEYVWWLTYNQRRALRNTILQDGCDAYFALPADAEYKLRGLQRSKAFIDVSYAVVALPTFNFSGLPDLKGKRIAVLHGSPPNIMLARADGFTTVSFREQEEALDALAKGEADVALLWGPSAGYDNLKRFQGRWRVTPVSGDGMGGQMAVAVRRGKDELALGIDRALAELAPEIAKLADKYGFPRSKPVQLARAAAAEPPALAQARTVRMGFVATADASKTVTVAATSKPAGDKADLAAGQSRFNDICSHCHGTNGASPVSERDLRRLKARYKDVWRETAITTIKNGRSDAGMPAWKTTYGDKEIEELLAFLSTIQR